MIGVRIVAASAHRYAAKNLDHVIGEEQTAPRTIRRTCSHRMHCEQDSLQVIEQ